MAKFAKFVDARCTPSLLMKLAMGKVETCPFDDTEIAELKGSVRTVLSSGDSKETAKMSRLTSVFWDCSSAQLMTLRWD